MAALAAGCAKPAPKVTIQEYMEGQINPAGDFLFRSVEEISDAGGVRLKAPSSDADWKAVRDKLAVLQAAPDILTAPGLKAAPPGFKSEHPGIESPPAWIQQQLDANRADFDRRAQRLKTTADVAAKAVDAKDPHALEKALDGVDKACESCHLHYFYPNDKRAWQAAKEDGGVD
jgi:cytochrome c556